jgi:hypothetical protein
MSSNSVLILTFYSLASRKIGLLFFLQEKYQIESDWEGTVRGGA